MKQLVLEMRDFENKNNINVLKHIVHLYCTCFILGPLRQDFIKIFRCCCFFLLFSHIRRAVVIRSKPTVGIA